MFFFRVLALMLMVGATPIMQCSSELLEHCAFVCRLVLVRFASVTILVDMFALMLVLKLQV